ncbi:DUF4253 domain-containing protein [Cyanobacterium stanieri LEGE 03274]|uniref:DUF4253 domain-containing protein n=1 Tax=Cyanobacterium stanieri LEGE 03274 TaxID=1828756 RepID=A0ABR9V3T4_9CHRO|nr:DUF4253 domain-containing protein [Cyanobacterium stanieri]MBE9222533.1 DUF4253 domain-containing protein [Cyanobacterium stanieri LEGE 03274]
MVNLENIKIYQTNGINYDVTTEDIIVKLLDWDQKFGITISNVSYDTLTVYFHNLPNNVRIMAEEIYEFCPDIIDQGYGCMDEILTMGQKIDERLKPLLQGVEMNSPDFGLQILENVLKVKKKVCLWWD